MVPCACDAHFGGGVVPKCSFVQGRLYVGAQVDLRRHNAAAALREAERRRVEAVTKATSQEAVRARLHADIAAAPHSTRRWGSAQHFLSEATSD